MFDRGRQAAFVVRKGALEYSGRTVYSNAYSMTREEAIGRVLAFAGDDSAVSTTGKASREVYELREGLGQGHRHDFLTWATAPQLRWALRCNSLEGLDRALAAAKSKNQLTFIEVKCALGAREDLGRPTTTPAENRAAFMAELEEKA